ncbi:helix-turn-helix and ligand-binding sensor domain-containing protein [Maribacter hydrothermalis]|uniref:Two component regulator three y domain-containing protein n=1 Tax=Maribacter hydrothermalis TaxID=1836467 RepID=A0A1B7ZFS4_9FLAO|nr:triple tyrosine motif-containing protein [Maribacter hydrothermalis]APQ19320.1 two component regulator three y domain-containing protein [Maribacter hydrothermalis]OBR42416.1 two component regulator three y domain-containing protein [Maribacter hydrothermalis]
MKSFSIIFILFSLGLFAQELPPIQNYTPIEYAAENQNWSIDQAHNKNIYVANNGGLLEFNGSTWQLYQSPYGTPIKSVKVIGDKVYTGSYMEFGFWSKDKFGDLEYTSISKNTKNELIEDEHFWNISSFEDWVLFQSLDRIYIYDTLKNSFEIIEAKTNRAAILEVENRIYFQKLGQGLFTIENGKPLLVSNQSFLKKDNVIASVSLNNNKVLITEHGEFYSLKNNIVSKLNISDDPNFNASKIYSALQLNDGSLILGTISNGIYHLDQKGKIIQHINQEKGLNNNTILSLFQDMDNNLWLGLDNGLSVLNLDSPFAEYIDQLGVVGVVYTAALFNDALYLGTNQGLFYKHRNDEASFKLIEGTQGQVWLLKEINGTLFCGHHNGTYVIEENKAKHISDFAGTWDIKPIDSNNNLLLQGNYKGLSILEKTNGEWKFRNQIEGFDISSRFFQFIDKHQILINHDFKGVFSLQIDNEYSSVVEEEHFTSKGTSSSLVLYNGDILYSTVNGVYKYLVANDDFVIDSILTSKFITNEESVHGILQPTDANEKLWGFTNNNIICVTPGLLSGNPKYVKVSIPKSFRRSMGVVGFESIVQLKNELYLIGNSNGYVTLDLNKIKENEFEIYINSITKEFYDSPKKKVELKGANEFNFSDNNLHFYYNVPEYDKYTEVNYQYKLEGEYDEWSSWSSTSNVSFANLSYGSYNFMVRAKIGNKISKNTSHYSFIIHRPWYLSIWAILSYICIGILFSILVHKLYKNYYRQQQHQIVKENKKKLKRKKLKNQKKIVQIKNEQLKGLIENKNRELAISTMSIIKKNEFLNAIKDKLKENENNPQIKSVIRTIDRNINNEDDWKFFENAFNNADKDFLKKVKIKHSELSAKDLRLCAYLRLNLSSKEIAPLLNISVRSVEVKRYRLRKKMNLSHEDSLTDYIMNL